MNGDEINLSNERFRVCKFYHHNMENTIIFWAELDRDGRDYAELATSLGSPITASREEGEIGGRGVGGEGEG